jgi:putative NIF3 family GTP cyclohydrolase 1 type 2
MVCFDFYIPIGFCDRMNGYLAGDTFHASKGVTMTKSKKLKTGMERRTFLKRGAEAAFGLAIAASLPDKGLASYAAGAQKAGGALKGSDIASHLESLGPWIDPETTTDTFKAGDPSKPVRTIAVAWKADRDALKEAFNRGADLFISHESIGVNAQNGSKEPDSVFALPTEKPKFDWLDETGLVVYRCHDVWDRYPALGVRDAWLAGLELGGKIYADKYPIYVSEINSITVRELARHILGKIKPLGQNGIIVSGDLGKKVRRVGTATGMSHNPVGMKELGADVGFMTDDGYKHVRMGVHARELDFPVIIVNHGVTEEWAIRNLAGYLQKQFPQLDIFHIPQFCPFTILC